MFRYIESYEFQDKDPVIQIEDDKKDEEKGSSVEDENKDTKVLKNICEVCFLFI